MDKPDRSLNYLAQRVSSAVIPESDLQPVPGTEEAVKDAAAGSRADATWRAYANGWAHFERYCAKHGRQALPAAPATVASYLTTYTGQRGSSLATMRVRLAAISVRHHTAGQVSPCGDGTVRTVLKGLVRRFGVRQKGKAAATLEHIERMIVGIDRTGPRGKRDAALLLLGYAGAFRRSELVGLLREDVSIDEWGVRLLIRRSKTDQAGEGRTKGIERWTDAQLCPVAALEAWLAVADDAPVVFPLSARYVAMLVKKYAKAAGFNPEQFSGHSLRAGHVTQAYLAGAPEVEIMAMTWHTTIENLRRYRRNPNAYQQTPTGRKVGK